MSDDDYDLSPYVNFFHLDGSGYIGACRGSPTCSPLLIKTPGENDKFRIIPVSLGSTAVVPLKRTQHDFLEPLPVAGTVAIQHERASDGKIGYLSCSRVFPLTGSCLATWRTGTTITSAETFEVLYCVGTDSFAFKSHTGCYLHYNNTFASVAFKPCRTVGPKKAQWKLLPASPDRVRASALIGKRDGFNSILRTLTVKPSAAVATVIATVALKAVLADLIDVDFDFGKETLNSGGSALAAGVTAAGSALAAQGSASKDQRLRIADSDYVKIVSGIKNFDENLQSETKDAALAEFVHEVGLGTKTVWQSHGVPRGDQGGSWSGHDIKSAMQVYHFMSVYVYGKEINAQATKELTMLALGFTV